MERKGRDRNGGGKAPTWRKRTPRCTPRRTPRRNIASSAREGSMASSESLICLSGGARAGSPFEFQKRIARIVWRTLHTIDVDRVIREVDIDTLESVLDTVAFGDIQGEDTRSFTEANFVKVFRLAQLVVEYLLHVQDLLADYKSGLLQSRANMEQKNEKIRSRFLCQRDALLQTRHDWKQAKKTLKTYEVMLKVQEKNQTSQSNNKPQVWYCAFCEKAFESSYYLDMHVARKHQNKEGVTDDKILAVVSTAEEATAARVKAEMSLAVQAEIQQLRERYQADLQRAETHSNAQVRTLQEDLRQSNNQVHEVQTRLEVLQAQILSAPPNNSLLGGLHAVEKSKEKHNGSNQERLYELERKFSGLERQVKTLGQENSRLLKELNVAYAEVLDLQRAKRQSVFTLETQVDDLRKENQHLRRTMSKVNNRAVQAGVLGDNPKPDELTKLKAPCRSPGNPSVEIPPLLCTSRIHSPPKSPQTEPVEVSTSKSPGTQEDEAIVKSPVHPCHEVPEPILAIIEAKEPDATQKLSDVVSNSQNPDNTTDLGLVTQPPNEYKHSVVTEDQISPVHQSPSNGRPMPLKKLCFTGGVMLTNMIEEEPVALSLYKEQRGCSTRERDEALRALARPLQRSEAMSVHSNGEPSEGESSPDHERCSHSTKFPVKRALCFLTPERMRTSSSYKERPKSTASKKIKLRGGANPTSVEGMRAKLEYEMVAVREEQRRRQKAVQQLLAKELGKEKVEERNKEKRTTKSEDTRSCQPATQSSYTSKSETLSESIAPLLLVLPQRGGTTRPSSTIHTVRKIVSNRGEIEGIQPKLGPLPGTRIQPFHSPPPYKPGPCCKRPLHPYLRRGIRNPQIQSQPRASSFHMAVLSSNPDLKNVSLNQIPNGNTVAPSKEHIMERLSAVTRELGKYFPAEKPSVGKAKWGTSSGSVQQPPMPEIETTKTETNETEEDEGEKRITPHADEKIPRLQEISEVASMDVGDVMGHSIPIPDTASEETHEETANDFGGQLRKELKKFGITSTTNGISDTTYKSISSALEFQRSVRMSQIHANERQIVEYERDAVVWHTQMALRDCDLVTVKSPFNVVTDSGSDHSSHANPSEDSVKESGRSHKKSDESGSESREDSRGMKPGEVASGMRSSEQSSPQSSSAISESSDDNMQEAQVAYKSKVVNWAKHGRVHLGPRSPPPEARVQHVSRTRSWEPTLQQAKSSRKNRDPPSRGELIRSITDVIDRPRQSEEEEVDEDAFGLGDWDSDEDAVPSTGKRRYTCKLRR